MDQSNRRCGTCKAATLHGKPSTNHLVHALVSLFVCGLWIPVWIMAASTGDWKCQTCGTTSDSNAGGAAPAVAAAALLLVLAGIVAYQYKTWDSDGSSVQTADPISLARAELPPPPAPDDAGRNSTRIDNPAPRWFCACVTEIDDASHAATYVTTCRRSEDSCRALERRARSGAGSLVALDVECRAIGGGEAPVLVLQAGESMVASVRSDGWQLRGRCALRD